MPKTSFKPVLQYHSNADGLFQVLIRIYHHQKLAYITTPISVQKRQFNAKTGKIIRHSGSQKYNDYLDKSMHDGKEAVLNARMEGRVISIDELKNVVSGQAIESTQSFLEYAKRFIYDNYDQVENYNRVRLLNWFLDKVIEYQGGRDLLIQDINNTYVRRFQKHYSEKLSVNSVNNLMSMFSIVINDIRHNNKISYSDNPFHSIKNLKKDVRKEEVKEHLSNAELEKIINYKGDYYRTVARDAFLIMYYLGGARCSEAVTLTNRNYLIDRFYFQEKSDKKIPIILHEKLDEVISKYLVPEKMDNYILPFIKSGRDTEQYYKELNSAVSMISARLKMIQEELNIKTRLRTRAARKTALDNAFKVMGKERARILAGHSSARTTEAYLENVEVRSEVVRSLFGG